MKKYTILIAAMFYSVTLLSNNKYIDNNRRDIISTSKKTLSEQFSKEISDSVLIHRNYKKNVSKNSSEIYLTRAKELYTKNQYLKTVDLLDSVSNFFDEKYNSTDTSDFIYLIDYRKTKGLALIDLERYGEALENFTKALDLCKKINNQIIEGEIYTNIGNIYFNKGNYVKSLDYLFKALKISEQTNNIQECAINLNIIGNVYVTQNNTNKSLLYLNKALEIEKKLNNKVGIAMIYNNLGVYYQKINNYELAIEYFNKSLQIGKEINKKFIISSNYNNFGIIYTNQKDFNKAINYYSMALEINKEINDYNGIGIIYNNLGDIYLQKNELVKSLDYVTKSIILAKKTSNLQLLMESELIASQIFEKQNKDKQAFKHFKNYVLIKDSIYNKTNNEKQIKTELEFEFEKKELIRKLENEKSEAILFEKNRKNYLILISIILTLIILGILFFSYNNRLQLKRNLNLEKDLSDYKQIALHLQMNPHFLFNCLGSISSYISQSDTDSALKFLSKFSKLMRLTLEYSKSSLIPIHKEVESIQTYLELEKIRLNNMFNFEIILNNIEDDMGIPPLLIQPFVENAILHGIAPNNKLGDLKISFSCNSNNLVCIIEDNGIGIKKSKEIKENSLNAHKSMALEITEKRLEFIKNTTNIKTSLKIENSLNNDEGTKVTIILPIQYIK